MSHDRRSVRLRGGSDIFSSIGDRLTYANVMATLAVFIALGGASYAALKIPANSVGSKELKDNSVRGKEIKNGVVGTKDLKPGSVGPDALQGNAVGYDNLAPLAVDGSKVKDGSIPYAKLDAATVAPRLFAHVSSSGVLGEQSGVVSAARLSKGSYQVVFNRDLHGCVATASVGFGFGPGVIGAGATAQARMNLSNNPAAVGVTVYRNGYTFNDIEDDDFHLIVAC